MRKLSFFRFGGIKMTEWICIYLPYIVIAVFLIIAAVFDARGGVIPIYLFPCLFGLFVPFVVLTGNYNLLSSFAGLLLGLFCFYIMARFFGGGGGDILMMSVLGFCLGVKKLAYIILLAGCTYLLFILVVMLIRLIRKKPVREILTRQYPYAPFVLTGYIVCYLAGWLI